MALGGADAAGVANITANEAPQYATALAAATAIDGNFSQPDGRFSDQSVISRTPLARPGQRDTMMVCSWGEMMSKTTAIELPTGAALERAIEEIEADTHDEQIRQTIIERLKMADEPETAFVPHDKVFSSSRERLMKKLAGKNNG